MAKVALVKGLSAAGVPASVERPGYSPLGEEWVADVFAQTSSGPVIFEVQLSQQHWDDYRLRTHRYAASGIRCMWLVRDTHFNAFTKARIRHLMSQGLTLQQARSEEHTSELQSLMRISYAVFCLNKKKKKNNI